MLLKVVTLTLLISTQITADLLSTLEDDGHNWTKTIEGVRDIRETESQDKRFISANNSVVTAQVESTALLHCRTSSTTGGVVSWIRKRDYQLLTVSLETHSMDDRFSINYVHWDWQLHIKYVQPRDAGIYECQVSSHPPTSIFLHLNVVEAEAEILGAPEKHVKAGSILRLVCILHYTTESPAYVFWYRDNQMINYNDEQSVVVESDEHTSVLLVTKADRQHSGNYTCLPSNAKPASILVHILNGELGEYPAAMQHGESTAISRPPHPLLLPSCILLLVLWTIVSSQSRGSAFISASSSKSSNDSDSHEKHKYSTKSIYVLSNPEGSPLRNPLSVSFPTIFSTSFCKSSSTNINQNIRKITTKKKIKIINDNNNGNSLENSQSLGLKDTDSCNYYYCGDLYFR